MMAALLLALKLGLALFMATKVVLVTVAGVFCGTLARLAPQTVRRWWRERRARLRQRRGCAASPWQIPRAREGAQGALVLPPTAGVAPAPRRPAGGGGA